MQHFIQRKKALAAIATVAAASVVSLPSGCGSSRAAPSAANTTRVGLDATQHVTLREEALAMLVQTASSGTAQARANAIEALIETPLRLEPILASAMQDANPGVRSVAAVAAGEAGLTSYIPQLRALTHDRDTRVGASARYALGILGDPVDLSPLAGMLLRSDSPLTRAHVAMLLGKLGNNSALPMIHQAQRQSLPKASSSQVRLMDLQFAEACVKLGDTNALHEIRAALYPARPEDLEATALAAVILGQVDDRASADQLIYLTARQDDTGNLMPAEVRLAAAASLAKLGLRQGGFIAEEYARSDNATHRAHAAYVFGELGQVEYLGELQAGLEDVDPFVRISAAKAVVEIAGSGSVLTSHPDG